MFIPSMAQNRKVNGDLSIIRICQLAACVNHLNTLFPLAVFQLLHRFFIIPVSIYPCSPPQPFFTQISRILPKYSGNKIIHEKKQRRFQNHLCFAPILFCITLLQHCNLPYSRLSSVSRMALMKSRLLRITGCSQVEIRDRLLVILPSSMVLMQACSSLSAKLHSSGI